MTTTTASKRLPEELLAAIKQFMEDNDVARVDVRRSGLPDEAEEEDSTYVHVMSDDELPHSVSLDAGAFITATVPPANL